MSYFMDKDEFIKYTEKLINHIIDGKREQCLAQNIDEDMKKKLMEMPIQETTIEEIYQELEKHIVPFCTDFHNPDFMGFPDAGNSPAGVFGAIAADLLQQNLINATFCAPIATYIEMAVIRWFRRLMGYENYEGDSIGIKDVGGIVTTGGTMSNAIAMLLARLRKCPESYLSGIKEPRNFGVIVPKGIAHYSIRSSLQWLGCGNQLIEVETKNFRYDLKELKNALELHHDKVMCVVMYVGDSRTMTIENIEDVCKVIRMVDENIWIHADACNGFCLGFSEKLKSKIKGIEKCDSISMDPHKMMQLPYTASVFLVKNAAELMNVTTKSDLIMNDNLSFGQVTPFLGSKSWMSLKIWCVIKYYGIIKLGKIMEERCRMAEYLKRKLEEHPDFQVFNEVDGFSVVFMYIPLDSFLTVDKINKIQKNIYNVMIREKKYYLHQFSISDQMEVISKKETIYPLRFFSGNEFLKEIMIDQMINYIWEKGKFIYENGLY